MNNYFSHDSNARDDEKILAMRADLGWEAYGLYWALIEMLRDASDYRLKTNYKVLAFSLHTSEEMIRSIINDYSLFSISEDGAFFFSSSLTKRMEEKEVLSKKRRSSANNRWKSEDADANEMQMQCKCNANASDLQCNTDANASLNKSKVKESKVNNISPSRAHESASAPGKEEKEGLYEIFFFRNLKEPALEFERFCQHNGQYGWKANNTPAKRSQAALDWIPEVKDLRVSASFLVAWKDLYLRLKFTSPDVAKDMLDAGSRLSVNNGAVVIHCRKSVQEYIKQTNPSEIVGLAKGNPLRFSWP